MGCWVDSDSHSSSVILPTRLCWPKGSRPRADYNLGPLYNKPRRPRPAASAAGVGAPDVPSAPPVCDKVRRRATTSASNRTSPRNIPRPRRPSTLTVREDGQRDRPQTPAELTSPRQNSSPQKASRCRGDQARRRRRAPATCRAASRAVRPGHAAPRLHRRHQRTSARLRPQASTAATAANTAARRHPVEATDDRRCSPAGTSPP